jgi:EAL domain-containing protein (putative c-di-GMP-specific phosphodiesterase class I)
VPAAIAVYSDTVYISYLGRSFLNLYSGDLEFLKQIELERPEPVSPTDLVVAESLLVIANVEKQAFAVYDHEGYYLSSCAWYPGKEERISPLHLSANLGMLILTDSQRKRVAMISLVDQPPFYSFLELTKSIPTEARPSFPAPTCAFLTPDSNVWIGDRELAKGFVARPDGRLLTELEQTELSRISHPCDFAYSEWDYRMTRAALSAANLANGRVHMLDRGAGKVFVYDLSGNLTLVYPQDRRLRNPLSIAVNISSLQVESDTLLDAVVTALRETGLPPGQLELEVTESALLRNEARAIETLGELKRSGVKLSLDDFGTGYSSLSYLRKLPIDTVKIDRCFVREIASNEQDRLFVSSILSMAELLGLDVVVEGVENAAQCEALREMGCSMIQGYYFSPGVPPEDVPGLVATGFPAKCD